MKLVQSWIRSAALLLLGATAVTYIRADVGYTLVNFGSVLPGAAATDINNSGDVLLDSGGHAFLYKNGTAYQIPENFGLTHLNAVSLNDSEQIVGTGTTAGGQKETFQYNFATSTGQITNYIPLGAPDQLFSINNLGMTSIGQYLGTAFITGVFDSSGNAIPGATGYGLNNQGDIWRTGGDVYNLVTDQVVSPSSLPFGVEPVLGDNGWMALTTPQTLYRGKWDADPIMLTSLGSVFPELTAYDMNANGQVVGSIWNYPQLSPYHGFVADENGIVDLNDVAPLVAGYFYSSVSHINDAGEMIGSFGDQYTTSAGAYLLIPSGSPVPEASSVTWMVSGMALLGAVAWRRRTARIRAAA